MNIVKKAIVFAIMLLIIIALVSLYNYIEAEDEANKAIENNNTEKKEPGFEGVFAIAGILAITYLVLRQRE